MTILVTNDDGDSIGLRLLLETAKKFDKAYAIIPNRQRSAIGCALTLHKPIRLHQAAKEIYAINGTPSDCVLFSFYSAEFEKPDLVLSGINWGENTGLGPMLGSGTIGACWQAALNGVPAIAFSIYKKNREWRDETKWGNLEKISEITERIICTLKPKLKSYAFFNVNFPEQLEHAEIAYVNKIQRKKYNTKIVKRTDPENVPYYWISGDYLKSDDSSDFNELIVNKKIVIAEVSLEKLSST